MQKRKKTRKEKIADRRNQQRKKKRFDKKNALLTIFFFVGIILTIFEIFIYRVTIIHWSIPTGIWLLTGIIFFRFNSKLLVKHFDTESIFLQIIYNILSFGGIVVFCLMFLNYKSSNEDFRIYTFKINRKYLTKGGSNTAKRQPVAEINYFGLKKDIIFPHSEIENVTNSDSILLKVKNGILGFDVIISKELISN